MGITFWMDDHHVSAAQAVGALPSNDQVPICALNVGDYVSFPGFRAMTFRVVSRQYRSCAPEGEPSWLLQLEPSKHPTDKES